jgi:hypothetical protein
MPLSLIAREGFSLLRISIYRRSLGGEYLSQLPKTSTTLVAMPLYKGKGTISLPTTAGNFVYV